MTTPDISPPTIEYTQPTRWHRIQLLRPLPTSYKARGFLLPPPGNLSGRFDIATGPTAYLADSPLTALYEALFRREVVNCAWGRLAPRGLAEFKVDKGLRLADLRGFEAQYPLLISTRYSETRALAWQLEQQGVDGLLYNSAQHPTHSCICLFPSGINKSSRVGISPLLSPDGKTVLNLVREAASMAAVPIIQD